MVVGQEHGWPSIKCICALYTNVMNRIKYNKTEQNIDYEKKGWDRECIIMVYISNKWKLKA